MKITPEKLLLYKTFELFYEEVEEEKEEDVKMKEVKLKK